MTTLSPQFFQLLEAEEKDVFFKTFDMIPSLYGQVFEMGTGTKAYEDRVQVVGLGTFVTKLEGTPVSFDDPIQGVQVRSVYQTFALGWRATMEMMEDDQFSIMSKMSADLGESAQDHMERLAWGLLNDAFVGALYRGLENDILFTTTHTQLRPGTGTQSNVLNPPIALGTAGIEAMMTLAETMTSLEGRNIRVKPTKLVIHPNLAHQAYVLLNTEYRTGVSDNDKNPVHSSRSGLTPVEVPYLTSQTNWFAFSPPGKNTLKWSTRKALTFSRAQDADTMDQKFYAVYRALVMWNQWQGNFASQS